MSIMTVRRKLGLINHKLENYSPETTTIDYFESQGDFDNNFLKLIENESKIDCKLSLSFDQYDLLNVILSTKELKIRKNVVGLYKSFFHHGLYKRSREGARFVYLFDLIDYDSGILILQSKDPKFGININPTKKTVRLAKPDINVADIYRFCYFYKDKNEIYLKAGEKSESKYFLDWLKIPDYERIKSIDNFNFNIYLKVGANNMMVGVSEEQLRLIFDKKDNYFEFSDNKFIIKNDNQNTAFNIDHIRVASLDKTFPDVGTLYNFFKDVDLDIIRPKLQYNSFIEVILKKSHTSAFLKSIGTEYKDRFDSVWVEYSLSFTKPKLDDEYLIFSEHNFIRFDNSFLDELIDKKNKGIVSKLYFVNLPRNDAGIKIGSFQINNSIVLSDTCNLLLHAMNDSKQTSKLIHDILQLLVLENIAKDNNKLKPFMTSLIYRINLDSSCYACILENSLIEYKMPDIFKGKQKDVVNYFVNDFGNKLKGVQNKIYVVGIHPKDRTIVDLDNRIYNDDNIREIIGKINASCEDFKIGEPLFIKFDDNKKILSFIVSEISDKK